MSGYDWSKVKKHPSLREQMLGMIAWANQEVQQTTMELPADYSHLLNRAKTIIEGDKNNG